MVCECECVYVCVARESVCGESGIVRDRPVTHRHIIAKRSPEQDIKLLRRVRRGKCCVHPLRRRY